MLDKKIYYPWFSIFNCIALFSFLLISGDTALFQALSLPEFLQNTKVKTIIVILFLFMFFVDVVLFRNRKKEIDSKLDKFNKQIVELQASRNLLQNRMQTYSGHADKLKLFISDRLLEYIEYDEKFLHFKNIASEVRHNGVISYDKVTTALKHACEQSNVSEKKAYKDALQSMIYLWDLLDLSTTDNISLYIANKLYKAEEEYYRQQFNNADDTVPQSPIFSLRTAMANSLQPFIKDMGNDMPMVCEKQKPYILNNSKFRIFLNDADSLLGNENYVRLMLENLLNNALFYQNQKKYAHKYSRVSVGLEKNGKYAKVSVYNNGPWIDAETSEKLFQLGFSTKRSKGVNGKGLGLYFVNEIVKGYEGKIEVHNITNNTENYTIRIKRKNGSIQENKIQVNSDQNGKLICVMDGEACSNNEAAIKVVDEIIAVQIAADTRQRNYELNYKQDGSVFFDPYLPIAPAWCVEFKPLKNSIRVVFRPIDKKGVQFDLFLPTAESRLEADYYELEEDELNKLDDVGVEFDDFSEYTDSQTRNV